MYCDGTLATRHLKQKIHITRPCHKLKIFVSQIHTAKGIILKDIDTAASVHKHLSELVTSNLRGLPLMPTDPDCQPGAGDPHGSIQLAALTIVSIEALPAQLSLPLVYEPSDLACTD